MDVVSSLSERLGMDRVMVTERLLQEITWANYTGAVCCGILTLGLIAFGIYVLRCRPFKEGNDDVPSQVSGFFSFLGAGISFIVLITYLTSAATPTIHLAEKLKALL